MPIQFHPKQGRVFSCDFRGNIYPEIDKIRPVVIFTPKYAQRPDLVAVVPLSTTAPAKICSYHFILESNPVPDEDPNKKVWAKCDLIQNVVFARLTGYWSEVINGKRQYLDVRISEGDMLKMKKAVIYSLGFSGLTEHIN